MTEPSAAPSPAPAEPAAAPPPRRPRLIRWWAVVLIPAMLLLAALALPLVIDPWVRSLVVAGLERAGLDLDPASRLSVSVFGARLHGEGIRLTARGATGAAEVARIAELDIDLALIDTLRSRDIVIESLVASGMSGDLRKRGRWSPIPGADDPKPDQPIDWATWYQRAMDAWKRWQAKQERERREAEEEARKPPSERRPPPPPRAATASDWPKAVHYRPTPQPGGAWSRVVIRRLEVTGTSLATPHETPLRIQAFSLRGRQLTNRQAADQDQTLVGELGTNRAGSIRLDWRDGADGSGHLEADIPGFPLELLGDPGFGGARLAAYGATGSAQVRSRLAWRADGALDGLVGATVAGLHLAPTAAAPREAAEIAQVVNRLKGRPIAWPVRLGGRVDAPEVVDSGARQVIQGALAEAARAELEERGGKVVDDLINRHGGKVPGLDRLGGAATAAAGIGGAIGIPTTATGAGGAIKDLLRNPLGR